jgi:hypothetical protein
VKGCLFTLFWWKFLDFIFLFPLFDIYGYSALIVIQRVVKSNHWISWTFNGGKIRGGDRIMVQCAFLWITFL